MTQTTAARDDGAPIHHQDDLPTQIPHAEGTTLMHAHPRTAPATAPTTTPREPVSGSPRRVGPLTGQAGRAVLALAGLTGSMLVLGTPTADAAVPGLMRVERHSAFDSSSTKRATATCPAGKRVVGAGTHVHQGAGEVAVQALRPAADLRSVTVRAVEADSYAGTWRLTAYAICAESLPGLQLVHKSSTSSSADSKGVTASCPDRKKLVGTGADITAGNGAVVLNSLRPNGSLTSSPTRHTAHAFEADPYARNWRLTAYAICATGLPGLTRAERSSNSASADNVSVPVQCRAGKRTTGMGVEIRGGSGEVVLNSLRPDGSTTQAPRTTTGQAFEEDPYPAKWRLTTYAICANQ
ncbi:hypothetical protein [Streptomyces poonensis]|nr:hypothetical protein [Streptomyces poonensis]